MDLTYRWPTAQVRAVRVKSEAAQAVQALVRVRLLQIKQMVQTGNQLRGLAKQVSDIRCNLVLAGQSLLTMIERREELPQDRLLIWAQRLLRRKQRNVAAIAVAAKLARIAWAVLAKDQAYRPRQLIACEHTAA